MKSTKLLTTLLVLLVSSTLFAQKVHYKDSYYTIVKSKIFHRGHDVFGRLTAEKRDTIYMIAKELYDERGKLKEQYKNTKKRDRYKLPEDFWEQKNIAVAEAANTTESKVTESTVVLNEDENQKDETVVTKTNASTAKEKSKIIEKKVINTIQKEKVTEDKKAENIVTEDKKVEKEEKKEEVAKSENGQEKHVKTQKEEAAKREKTTIVREKRKLEKEEKLVRNEEKKAVMNEKIKQQKEEKKEKVTKHVNEQEKLVKAEKEEAAERKDKKSKTEKAVVKEKREEKKSTEKIEKKNKELEKEKNTQLKKQKSIEVRGAALLVSASISNNDSFGTIYIKVNKEKTSATKSGDILLFFDVINNSNKDLVILKPNNSIDRRLDFFSNTMECRDIPITSTDYMAKDLKIKDEDYLTIPANAKIEVFINGKYRSWLACSSEDIILQIQYNPFKNAEVGTELQSAFKKELSKSLKKITPIKMESENIKFKLNKQE